MTEAQLLARIEAICRRHHVRCQHTYCSRGSRPGWPDLTLVGRRVIYRELKVGDRQPAPEQILCLTQLAFTENLSMSDVGLWRETDLATGRIEAEIAAIATEPLRSERELGEEQIPLWTLGEAS